MLKTLFTKTVLFLLFFILFFSCNNIKKNNQPSCVEVKSKCLKLVKDNLPQVMKLLVKNEYEDSDVKNAFKQFKFFDDLEEMEQYLEVNCPLVNEDYENELKEYLALEGIKYLLNN